MQICENEFIGEKIKTYNYDIVLHNVNNDNNCVAAWQRDLKSKK